MTIKNIGMGDTHHDFSFVNGCLPNEEHYQNLLQVESRYHISENDAAAYKQLLETADNMVDWRYRIARWMLRIADDFLLKRETALIALNYFDRIMMRQTTLQRDSFQVAAITCILMASKLFQKKPPKLSTLVAYTKNAFKKEDILTMEQQLLFSGDLGLYPISSSTFVSILLSDLANETPGIISSIVESCQFMIELAATDFFFVGQRSSSIAVAAIVVTFETTNLIAAEVTASLLRSIQSRIDYTKDNVVMDCIDKLRSMHNVNLRQIEQMEDNSSNSEIAKYTTGKESDPQAARVATPSPTDPCQCNSDSPPPIIGDKERQYSNGSRKRRRRSPDHIENEIV